MISELTLKNGIQIPGTVPEISLLLLFIATSFVSQLVGGGSSSESESSYSSSDRETGTVKWFNVRKGYGFITRDAGDDVFVHFRNIEGSGRRAIEEGQRVSFVVPDGDKGLHADFVKQIVSSEQGPGVLSVGFYNVQPWFDVPELG